MKFSLKRKTILLIVAIGLLVGLVSVIIYDKGIHSIIQDQYSNQSIDLAKTVAMEIEKDRVLRLQQAVRAIYEQTDKKVYSDQWGTPEFNEYISLYSDIEKTEDFQVLRDHLRRIQDVNHVNCIYLLWLDRENKCLVYLVDGAYEDACPPGCIDPIYGDFQETLDHPEVGFHPNITNTPEYGWLIATDMPVFDDAGNVIAYAAVDISMNDIMMEEYRDLIILTIFLFILTVIICFVGISLVRHLIVDPINSLSKAAVDYSAGESGFSDLNIRNKDEIGALADNMVRMEKDINGYIDNLKRTTDELMQAREHAVQMETAANIDALTKVRNKRAYDIEITHLGDEPYGFAMIDLNDLKGINDTYGHEKGDIAIKKLCAVVCRIFKHSPVYRIGGDEFVVILKKLDYENRNALAGAFKDEIRKINADKTLPAWERVSAAIGCAVYDEKMDSSPDSVFKRADKAMYADKKLMKEE